MRMPVDIGRRSLWIPPISINRGPGDRKITKPVKKVIKEREFVWGEDVSVGLRLYSLPKFTNGAFEYCSHSRVNLAVFAVSRRFERT